MLIKIRLIFDTVKYLKTVQVLYQVYYRLKPAKSLTHYSAKKEVDFKKLKFSYSPAVTLIAKSYNDFEFLNITKKFVDDVDWNYQGNGKLWNYNLQYFNFIHQDFDNELKNRWLNEIGDWLRDRRLSLEPYPVSLRAMNTLRYLSQTEANERVYSDLYGQLTFLSKRLEFHLLGNHLLENAFALMMGGAFFQNKKWLNTAKKLLYKELNEQILTDGAHFELSPMYHQIILFRLLEFIDWYKNYDKQNEEFLAFTSEKAGMMISWLKNITFANGDIPHFNDSAPNIALTSLQLFEFADVLNIKNNDISLGESGYRKYITSKYECVVDVAPVSCSYQPGHGHADALSFILYVNNKPLFVEQGTSTYQSDSRRVLERSTQSHNTVVVNGVNQSQVWDSFKIAQRAVVKVLLDNEYKLIASHTGYKNIGVIHQRSFIFGNDSIVLEDVVKGKSKTDNIIYFHFHPDVTIRAVSQTSIIADDYITISFEGEGNDISIEDYDFSLGFNSYKTGKRIKLSFNQKLNSKIFF